MDLTEDQYQFVKSNYLLKSQREIGRELGIPQKTMSRKMNMLNMVRPKGTEFNHNFFKEWNRESAYLIGFTLADGSLDSTGNGIIWDLHIQDISQLNLIRFLLKTKKHICFNKNRNSAKLALFSKEAQNDLISKGVVQRKSYKNVLVTPPSDLFWHFLRGYIDGDGSIRRRNKAVTIGIYFGKHNKRQAAFIFKELSKRGFKSKLRYNSKCYNLYFNKEISSHILPLLYKDSCLLRLSRKYLNYTKQVA